MNDEKIIKVENVSFAYHSHNVINNVSAHINKGEFVCIVGENGGGKSTLVKCIVGLNKNYKGNITVIGRVAYLSQLTEVQNNFPATIEEIVLSGTIANRPRSIFYNKEDKRICREALEKLALYDMRKKCFRELSGGQKQRVLIARAMCSTAKIIVLDEPTNGLDPTIAAQVYEALHTLNKENGITIVMVSHDIHRALENADRVIQITKGEIVFNDVPSKFDHRGCGK
ncbi:MAG: metal ABC transporter ATP-binding protein [Oscillospiraceae bacterium]|nr:metal ABC transporter ATP-binding protein [Oscillospiraceae bacterium]